MNLTTNKLATQISSFIPGSVAKKDMIFLCPVKSILKGICFERSASDECKFYMSLIMMPLCIPVRHVNFTFGGRFRRNSWDLDDAHVFDDMLQLTREAILERLAHVNSNNIISTIKKNSSFPLPHHAQQAVAYLLAYQGEHKAAAHELDALIERINPAVKWQADMKARAEMLLQLVLTAPENAIMQLKEWEQETLRNLDLLDLCNG